MSFLMTNFFLLWDSSYKLHIREDQTSWVTESPGNDFLTQSGKSAVVESSGLVHS